MKKSINNQSDLDEIMNRMSKLTPETRALWGKMNVRQMLKHVSMAAGFAFESPDPGAKKKSILKWMIFNIPAPKNAKTYPALDTVANKIDPADLENEKNVLRDVFNKISASNGPFTNNPFLGPLTKKEWGELCYLHANHHFKQFGA